MHDKRLVPTRQYNTLQYAVVRESANYQLYTKRMTRHTSIFSLSPTFAVAETRKGLCVNIYQSTVNIE